ncbi:MAG: FAM151 family protein [Vicingaceae bacterium]|nr:FAM151 family protein [Vicingaceae bacterium]
MKLLIKKIVIFCIVLATLLILAYKGITTDFFLTQLYDDKIWVHRVNSIDKLQEVNTTFFGVELDIVFGSTLGNFNVNHPPATSIGLSLLEYLKSNKQRDLNFWLDFKNLSPENAVPSLKRLEFLCTELIIPKKQFIIETTQPELLKLFANSGFQTSYYLHWPGLYQLTEEDLNKTISQIKARIFPELTYISSSYHDFEIMQEHFPDQEKLLWLTENETKFSSKIQEHLYRLKIINDPTVKVLLVQIKTEAPNR